MHDYISKMAYIAGFLPPQFLPDVQSIQRGHNVSSCWCCMVLVLEPQNGHICIPWETLPSAMSVTEQMDTPMAAST